ncbi:Protein TTR-39 a [Aphelenchoides avenae]|nr:Protein TTR-39 a [Aphelenchus avenae]
MRRSFAVAVFLVTLVIPAISLPLKSFGSNGHLLCNGVPAAGERVELWDAGTLDADQLISTTRSVEDGSFRVSATIVKFEYLRPFVKILHNCGSERDICKKFTPPKGEGYESRGVDVEKWFDLGGVDLDKVVAGEDAVCDVLGLSD